MFKGVSASSEHARMTENVNLLSYFTSFMCLALSETRNYLGGGERGGILALTCLVVSNHTYQPTNYKIHRPLYGLYTHMLLHESSSHKSC